MSIPLLLQFCRIQIVILDQWMDYLFHMDFKSDFYGFCRIRVFHIQVFNWPTYIAELLYSSYFVVVCFYGKIDKYRKDKIQ